MSKKLKILFISHYFPPEMGAAAARISGLSKWLYTFGHEVTVITGFPNYPNGYIHDGYRNQLYTQEMYQGTSVIRTWIYPSSNKSTIGRLFNYLSFMISSTIYGLRFGQNFDAIIASSPPLFVGITGSIIAKRFRIPWIFDIRDIWPNVAVEAGEFTEKSMIVLFGKIISKYLYRNSNHITPVTLSKRENLIASGVKGNKITVVSNGIDLDVNNQKSEISIRDKYNFQNKFLLVYAGLIGIAQGINIIVEVAAALADKSEFQFLIVGDGVQRQKMCEKIQKLHLTNITFLPAQPRRLIPSIIKSADIALVPLVSQEIKDAIPTKLYEAWSFKKPVLLLADGESAMLVDQVKGGQVVNPGNLSEVVNTILEIEKNRAKLLSYGVNGYLYVIKHLGRNKLSRILESVINRVTDKCY